MRRRTFLKAAGTGAALLATHPHSLAAALLRAAPRAAVPASITVMPAEPVGPIAREIYGHFAEHIGGVIYDGIWVGEGSKVANVAGIRKALIDALRKIAAPVIRWPGGCFADSYNWRDGIGPRAQRPRRPNFWVNDREWPKGCPDGPWKYEPNEFGTDDFARFCRLAGAEPYFAANVRSLSARDFYEWVDYCNAPAHLTSLGAQRAAGGEREPFHVRYWGVGNESWGCGGNFRPEDYASEYRRFIEWVPRFGEQLRFVASGPNGGDVEWTKRFFASMAERGSVGSVWGWALHHYSWNVGGKSGGDWYQDKGAATGYPIDEWYELLAEASRVETLIRDHWTAMAEADPKHRVKLVVDEWGAWHRPGTEVDPTHLFGQQSTIRNAVLAGLTLDVFNRHVDKVAMANVAQLVNNLHSLFFAHEDRFAVTPTYHVFDMYQVHQGATSVRVEFGGAPVSHAGRARAVSLPALTGSASIRDRRLTLTVTNVDAGQPREAAIDLRGAKASGGTVTTLVAGTLDEVNTFDAPDRVRPRQAPLTLPRDGAITHTFPPASVTRLQFDLA